MFTADKICDTMFQICPFKAPSVDGFPDRFFQRNWVILKEDITGNVKKLAAEGIMPEDINDTVIVHHSQRKLS